MNFSLDRQRARGRHRPGPRGDGADLLVGGLLNDTLTGNASKDILRCTAVNEFDDPINDFARNQDRSEVAYGALDDDADGTGGTATVSIACIANRSVLAGTDIHVIARGPQPGNPSRDGPGTRLRQ
jgi:hypothetical protein